MTVQPPCCMSYQKAAKLIAIARAILVCLALLILTVCLLVIVLNYSPPPELIEDFRAQAYRFKGNSSGSSSETESVSTSTPASSGDESPEVQKKHKIRMENGEILYSEYFLRQRDLAQAIVVIVVSIFLCTMSLVIEVQLLKGAIEMNYWRVNAWFQVQLIGNLINLVLTPVILIVLSPVANVPIWIACVIQFATSFYLLWIIYAFMSELKAKMKEEESHLRIIPYKA